MKEDCFHPIYFRNLCVFLEREGADVPALLAQAHVQIPMEKLWEDVISFEQGRQIILAAQRAVGRPTLALELAETTTAAMHGIFGHLLVSSSSLRQALGALERFLPLRTNVAHCAVTFNPEGATVEFLPDFHLGDIRAFLFDHLAASMAHMLNQVNRLARTGMVLHLPWSESPWADAYLRIVGKVVFGAPKMVLFVPADLLDVPCITASPADFEDAWRFCEQKMQRIQGKPVWMQQLQQQLANSDTKKVQIDQVAESMGVSRRTLLRRLQAEGTTFRDMQQSARREQALWLLRYTSTPINEVARNLGYKDESNFSRTCRHWFGATPSEVRRSPENALVFTGAH